ncbi:hypothetical protein D1614_18305 [Maribellus luteus]|uniref:Uncharacterized protein n=1 Tax=Maribellus luteus TaxID=2305463 RepID=A0A399SVF7_9BACT|nr:hypothetical protein D1614_18305 [Maribellus luteus]
MIEWIDEIELVYINLLFNLASIFSCLYRFDLYGNLGFLDGFEQKEDVQKASEIRFSQSNIRSAKVAKCSLSFSISAFFCVNSGALCVKLALWTPFLYCYVFVLVIKIRYQKF